MNVLAKFIGKSSLGFQHGDNYQLDMLFTFTQGRGGGVYISNGKGLNCEYAKVSKFIENWKILTINQVTEYEIKFNLHLEVYKSLRGNKLDILLN